MKSLRTHPSLARYGLFFGVFLFSWLALQPYASYLPMTSDDFFSEPNHIYERDGRWVMIPLMYAIDNTFQNHQLGRPLAAIVLAVVVGAVSTIATSLRGDKTDWRLIPSVSIALALLSSPNLLWAGGMWSSSFAFLGLLISLLAIRWLVARKDGALFGPTSLWFAGLSLTFFSYQPFALVALVAWLTAGSAKILANRSGWRGFIFVGIPVISIFAVAGLSIVLTAAVGSSRFDEALQGAKISELDPAILLATYGRPEQLVLITAIVLTALLVTESMGREGRARKTQTLIVFGGITIAVVLPPLALAEAQKERFATSILISVLVGLLTVLASSDSGKMLPAQNVLKRIQRIAYLPLIAALIAMGAFLVQQPTAAAAVIASLIVSAVLTVVWVSLKAPIHVASVGLILVTGLALIQFSQSRTELADNALAVGLDRQVAADIFFEINNTALAKDRLVELRYEVVGWAPWYSPLLRDHVSGPEVLEYYLSAGNARTFNVQTVDGECAIESDERIDVTVISPTSARVCVYIE